jgi:hypothetical protein
MNAGKSFIGCFLRGIGFTFDDNDKSGIAGPVSEMRELVNADARNKKIIFPFIGGEEVNDSPTHAHDRYAINFGSMEESQAKSYDDLWNVILQRVKPERDKLSESSIDATHKRLWWRYANDRPEMMRAIANLDRVLVTSLVTKHLGFAFLPSKYVYSHKLAVFPLDSYASFCAMQCSCHEIWSRFFSSTLEDRLNYAPSDCFQTFPFPKNFESNGSLEAAGKEYYEFRAALMVRNNEGLTKTYNRFHNPDERDPKLIRLRALHAAMDRAVLDAYGWTDLHPTHEFLLDYEEDEDTFVVPPSGGSPDRLMAELRTGKSPGATAGPTTSATKCWRDCWI